MKYNLIDRDGCLMLGMWVDTEESAEVYRKIYVERYGTGNTPYPNGKGYYPDLKLRVVCAPSPRNEMEG